MKKFIVLVLFLCSVSLNAQSIDGRWKAVKGTTEFIFEFSGGDGTIISLSSTEDYTAKILYGRQYTNISKISSNEWEATRRTWRYSGVTRADQENGRWVELGKCRLTLSADGNTLSEGNWTWRRVNR